MKQNKTKTKNLDRGFSLCKNQLKMDTKFNVKQNYRTFRKKNRRKCKRSRTKHRAPNL